MSVDKSPMDTYPMRLLRVGEVITPTSSDESYTVLGCDLLRPSDVDAYAVWLILCHLPHNEFHPFAVWQAYDRPAGWSLGNGEYFRTFADAVTYYGEAVTPYLPE